MINGVPDLIQPVWILYHEETLATADSVEEAERFVAACGPWARPFLRILDLSKEAAHV